MASRKHIFSLKNAALVCLGISIFVLAHLIFNIHFSPVRMRYSQPPAPVQSIASIHDVQEVQYFAKADTRPILDDPYNPPLVFPETETIIDHQPLAPINIRTRGIPNEYRQLGLLTRNSGHHTGDKVILPLMGRNMRTGRDKWQYYTMSNSPGTIQTRLPVSVNGKSCSSEYGCDSISNGDIVFVDGYEETFRVTLYETGLFSYLSNI